MPLLAGVSLGGFVVLTDNGNYYWVKADAIKFVRDSTATADIIVDNGDAGASSTGTWTANTWTVAGIFWGPNYSYHANPQSTGASYTWAPALAASGRYRVYARWPSWSSHATNARYTVHHAGGTTVMTRNQKIDGGRWMPLGEFDLTPSSGHKVVVDDDGADSSVIADAVRFVRIGDSRRVAADAVKIVPNSAEDALYVHNDHLGAPQKMTDASAAIVWDSAVTPFGLVASITGTATNNQRVPGQYADAVSGLSYNYFRHYDPSTGRYITSDPIGLAGGLNTYAYVGGNPVMYVDPTGESAIALPLPIPILGPALVIGGTVAVAACALSSDCIPAILDWLRCNLMKPSAVLSESADDGAPDGKEKTKNPTNDPKLPFADGPPGGRKNRDVNGQPHQDRIYGDDGYPAIDIDYSHDHEDLGRPHAHDWGRPAGGGAPNDEHRTARPVKPGEAR